MSSPTLSDCDPFDPSSPDVDDLFPSDAVFSSLSRADIIAKIRTFPQFQRGTVKSFIQLLLRFQDLFPRSHLDMPGIKDVEYHLDLPPHTRPIAHRLRRYSDYERSVIKAEVDAMLHNGIIEPTSSPWCFRIVLAPKPDGALRFCVDFRPPIE